MSWRNIIIPLICLCAAGCVNKDFDPDKWDIEQSLYLSKKSSAFSSEAGADTIKVETNYRTFTTYIIYDDLDDIGWCSLQIDDQSGIIIIKVEPNTSTKQRSATIVVSIGRNKYTSESYPIVQTGGSWDIIAGYTLFLSHEITKSQKEILEELLRSFIKVEGGTFDMGAGSTFGPGTSDYHVTLDDFIIGKYEITQKQWQGIMGSNPSVYRGENHPVENISWDDALEFCRTLSELTNLIFKLPTEAQWEYAAKGGKLTNGYKYSGSDDWTKVAHNYGLAILSEHPSYNTADVGTKLPNELGIYDMSGNVSEYCQDLYDVDYPSGYYSNPAGPSIGEYHVIRGGDFSDNSNCLTSTYREGFSNHSGLRIVLCE